MTLANVVRLNTYTTDVGEYLKHFTRLTDRFGGSRFATSLLGVSQLPAPDLVILLEATAVD
jgi:enamine deaminase RidA (YjgF/YER057c/UK114 family)